MNDDLLDLEDEEPDDSSGEDTQLRFHYQAQRIACLAVSTILSHKSATSIFCELHEDGLAKHADQTYTAYQYKTRDVSQPKFRATERPIQKAIRNFVRHERRFGKRIRSYVLATNFPFEADSTKNDLSFLIGLAETPDATTNSRIIEFFESFTAKFPGFIIEEIVGVLRKTLLIQDEPAFEDAEFEVVDALRKLKDLEHLDDSLLVSCARTLIAKVEDCSRKPTKSEVGSIDSNQSKFKRLKKKALTSRNLWTTIQSSLRSPLGTPVRELLSQSIPQEFLPVIRQSFTSSMDSLRATKRVLADGTRFKRDEADKLFRWAVARTGRQMSIVLGEPGAGKSALLAELSELLTDAHVDVFAIKCEDIPTDLKDQTGLAEFAGLPYIPINCISAINKERPVVCIIDQLDAIGALADTQTARMQVVLGLARSIKNLTNAKVILSCRQFDSDFDVRISGLDAEETKLQLPSIDDLKNVLSRHGLDCSQWPADIMEVLRNPQHLDIFISLLTDATEEITTVKSYLDLLGILWSKRVLPADEDLLFRMCNSIRERKQLFAPVVEFAAERNAVDRLCGAGILRLTNNTNRVSFAHQTLFEYCMARSFVAQKNSLSDFVLERQNSLQIRPLIWNCLHFLRNCDPQKYESELRTLLRSADIRPHIRSLLYSFISQASPLIQCEKTLLLQMLRKGGVSEPDTIRICKNVDWFDVLATTYIPKLMAEGNTCNLALRILSNGCETRQDSVIQLLQNYWFDRLDRDQYTLDVMREIKHWDLKIIKMLCTLIRRNDFPATSIGILFSNLVDNSPEEAPIVISEWLKQQYLAACKQPRGEFNPPEDITDGWKRHVWVDEAMRDDPRIKAIQWIIDCKQAYFLSKAAKQAPTAFVASSIDVFCQMVQELIKEERDINKQYCNDVIFYTGQKRDKMVFGKDNLPTIFAKHIGTYAIQNTALFEQFVLKMQHSSSLFVHRLICWGLTAVSEKLTATALSYLLGDDRRLAVGTTHNPHSESIELIGSLSPHLDSGELETLQTRILNWEWYVHSDLLKEEPKRETWQREHRLRLLGAIPLSLRNAELQAFIESEAAQLPGFDKELMSEPKVVFAESPMSSEEMTGRASVEEIQALFEELDDDCEENPNDWMLGGVREASREFEKLAEVDFEKALEVSRTFVPDKNELSVAYLIRGLGRSDKIAFDHLENTILDFANRGFCSDEFISAAASVLESKLRTNETQRLSEETVSLIEQSLKRLKKEPARIVRNSTNDSGSILWSGTPCDLVPTEGLYPLLSLLTSHYMSGPRQQADRWFSLLEDAINLRSDPLAWECFSSIYLWRLSQVDHERSRTFIKLLIDKQPEMVLSKGGVVFLSSVMPLLDPLYFSEIANQMRKSNWHRGSFAFGELACLNYFVHKHSWSRAIMEEVFSGTTSDEELILGICQTAGTAWRSSRYRQDATKVVHKLLDLSNDKATVSLAEMMVLSESFLADENTFELIRRSCQEPKLLRLGFAEFVETMPELILWAPELAFELVKAMTEEAGSDFLNYNTRMPFYAKTVVNATHTLQEIPGLEDKALELFERQSALGLEEAHKIVREIDRLPMLT